MFFLKINNRNHRKIVIIDRIIVYTGGFNIGDEYLTEQKLGYWRDTHIKLEGSIVYSFLIRFVLDWRFAGNKDFIIDDSIFVTPKRKGNVLAQSVSSGPNNKLPLIKLDYLQIINNAKKYIYIQTPYFIIDPSFLEALQLALLKGVKINIMIPNKKDHIFVYWATYSFIGDLLPYGLNAYFYNNGFLHSKLIIIDDNIISVGSANFDERSFKLNFETNVFLYGKDICKQFKNIFENDLKHCSKISLNKYNNRSIFIRLKEPICRLIYPIL